MLATRAYLRMVSSYVILNAGIKATLTDRVKHAAFVIELLRLSRSYVANSNGLNLKENFMPRQTYSHVILSCFSCVLKIMAQRRLNPKLPVCQYKSGSNCCEENFSELGGFGRIAGFKRNYTAGDAIEGIGDVNTLNLYAADPRGAAQLWVP